MTVIHIKDRLQQWSILSSVNLGIAVLLVTTLTNVASVDAGAT